MIFSKIMMLPDYTSPMISKKLEDFQSSGYLMWLTHLLETLLPSGLNLKLSIEMKVKPRNKTWWSWWTLIFAMPLSTLPRSAVSRTTFLNLRNNLIKIFFVTSHEGNRCRSLQDRYQKKKDQSWNCLRQA